MPNEPTIDATKTDVDGDNAIGTQLAGNHMDNSEFLELSEVIRKERRIDKRVVVDDMDEQVQAGCSTSHIGITNKFEILNQGGTSSDAGKGGHNHPIPP